MEKMIEFVLSRVPLRLLSFYPLPVSVNQIISLPCQHTLLVEQSELICRRALRQFLPLPLPFFFSFLLVFLLPTAFFRNSHRQFDSSAASSSFSFEKERTFLHLHLL